MIDGQPTGHPSLAAAQAELARQFTSAAARARFDGDAALGAEIARYANGLIAKRRLDVEKWLPLTAKALGPRFAALMREAMAEPPPGARADALALVARLRAVADPPWIGELAAYEAEFLRAWRPGAYFTLRRYRWPVGRIADQLVVRAEVGDVRPGPTLAVWWRPPGGRLRHNWRARPS